MTRAVILAAGLARRLGDAAGGRPKALVELGGSPLLDRQLAVLRARGIEDVTAVVGPMGELIADRGVATVANPRYAATNMVASLFCARELLTGDTDVLVAYGDIVYEPKVLDALLTADGEVAVAVDRGWRALWEARMEDVLADAESLRVAPDGRLAELGRAAGSVDEIEGQYIGLTLFRAAALPRVLELYDGLDPDGPYEGRDRDNMFMTALIQLLIERDFDVRPAFFEHGWLEVDRPEDLATYESMLAHGTLSRLYDPDA
jgi:L-glutamine-phosphate cytidylyltransferase